jgi:hypothetical protein
MSRIRAEDLADRDLALPEPIPVPVQAPARHKRKGRRKRKASSLGGRLRYYTDAIGTFGWILIAMTGLWLVGLLVALVSPGMGRLLVVAGNGLILIGNVWIAFIAYRDSHVFGMLCFFTCLFTYVYILMNLEETWQPAALTGLGFLFLLSGLVVLHLAGAAG